MEIRNKGKKKAFGKRVCDNARSKKPSYKNEKIPSDQNIETLAVAEPKTPLSKSVLKSGRLEGWKLPSQVFRGLSIQELDHFYVYLEHTHQIIRLLDKPENNILFLLTTNTISPDRKIKVLSDWAKSEDGRSLCNRMLKDISCVQKREQLALTVVAWMSYRQLVPDQLDGFDQPITGSYLGDLDAHLDGEPLGNSGIVGLRMGFSLLRVLNSYEGRFRDLINCLGTAFDLETPLLHLWDGLSDQYWSRRIMGQPHESAMEEVSQLQMPNFRRDKTKSRQSAMSVPQPLPNADQEPTSIPGS
ncbi:hypothetical protein GJ744_001297 [Endocarpon pusillum]|uniref:Uncharacterized protein n=1 Tax=Endocarpon pusillum TaxID=364733 RepID=A0A8H7E1X3_9EURO|nr:hypothetical protein GJ744_001297 [Endocarpon pusillum]